MTVGLTFWQLLKTQKNDVSKIARERCPPTELRKLPTVAEFSALGFESSGRTLEGPLPSGDSLLR